MDTNLSKDELIVKKEIFTQKILLFWLKSTLTLTNKRLIAVNPNTFLFIPFGKRELTQPLKNIASVTSSTKFHFGNLLFGLILGVIGLVTIKSYGIFLILLGLYLVLNSFTSTLMVTNNAGATPPVHLSILEKDKLAAFVRDTNHRIAEL
jgi:hypothetical protein